VCVIVNILIYWCVYSFMLLVLVVIRFFSDCALRKLIHFQMTNVGWLVLSFNGNKYRGR
jgi:hypothetical protein